MRTGLWRNHDFLKLWTGSTISAVGSQITLLALPLVAVTELGASPAQMGLLSAAGSLPALLIGLFIGVWVDRHRRRPVLIAADLGRAGLLLAIPTAALLGVLGIEHLYVVTLLAGGLSLVSNVADNAYLPSLVGREQLVEANSRLEVSNSIAQILGPGLAGWLVQAVTAPLAIAVDAFTFLISALFIGWIRAPEPPPVKADEPKNVWREIGEGLRLVAGNDLLRPLAGCVATIYLFNSVVEAVFILYVTRDLRLTPGLLGLVFAAGSLGFLVGALLPGWMTRRFGLGPGITAGLLLVGLSDLLVPFLSDSLAAIVIVFGLITAQFAFGVGLVIFTAGQVSLRQMITPDRLQGRMNATLSFITWGIVPLGALLGGGLGEALGLRPTLVLAAIGELSSALWLLGSPVWSLRDMPSIDA